MTSMSTGHFLYKFQTAIINWYILRFKLHPITNFKTGGNDMKLGKTEHNNTLRLYIRRGKIHGGFSVEIINSQMYDHYFFKVYNKMK